MARRPGSPDTNPPVRKICPRCETEFSVPTQRAQKTSAIRIQCFPCPECMYVADHCGVDSSKTGRCRVCSIPFSIIDHHAKGCCNRDYTRLIRYKNKGVG